MQLQAGMVLGFAYLIIIGFILLISLPITLYLKHRLIKRQNQALNQNRYQSIYSILQFIVIYISLVLILTFLLFQIEVGPT